MTSSTPHFASEPVVPSRLRTASSDVPDSVIAEIVAECARLISAVYPGPIGLFVPSSGLHSRMTTAGGRLPEVSERHLLEAIHENRLVEISRIAVDDRPLTPAGEVADAVMAMPVRAPDGEPIAAMFVARSDRHIWTDAEVVLLRGAVRIVENDARLRFAAHVIEQRERTTVVLAELGAELSALTCLDDFGPAINRAADRVSGCDATIVVELHDSRVRLHSNSGIDDQLTAGVAAIDVGDQGPIGYVLTDGRPRYFETKADLLEQHPVLARIIAPGLYHAWGAVPILNGGVPLGAIVCHWMLPTQIPEVTRGALEELGRIAGLALARLREQETARLLAQVEAALSASATVEQVVQVATDLVTPLLGAFTVDLGLVEDGQLLTLSSERLAVAGIDIAPADQPIASSPIRRTEMVHLTSTSDWSRFPALAHQREITGAVAMLSQPVLSNGTTLGILTATYLDERDCGPYERHRATEVSVMIGRAIRRAALLDRERQITNELQRSILPHALPGVAGYTVVACYLGAESGVDVGGDWFDCFELERDRLALVVGDIVGHGLHAAGATGQLRSACRAVADLSEGPADVVERLDHFARQTPNTRFATMFYAELAPATGAVSCCRAGHLPPILVDADGRPEVLENDGSWLIGLDHAGPRSEGCFEIPNGGRLIVFTDGIIERRGESVDAGYRRLCASIARRASLHGDALAEAIVADMAETSTVDDRCLMIVERL